MRTVQTLNQAFTSFALRFSISSTLICLVLFASCRSAKSQNQLASSELDSLRKQIEQLRQAQEATQREVHELKALLGARASSAVKERAALFHLDSTYPAEGSTNSSLVLLEFSDYQCQFCEKYFQETYPLIKQNYIDTGKILYLVCDFPLATIHKEAVLAAKAAHCAADQAKFWDMRSLLFANRSQLCSSNLVDFAAVLGLEVPRFRECLATEISSTRLQEHIQEASNAGVQGTPSIALGFLQADGKTVKIDRILRGDPPYDFLDGILRDLLSRSITKPAQIRESGDLFSGRQ
jgi:protein-disulfide isomerase